MFITAFTKSRHLSLFWARSIQSMPPPILLLNIHFNIILPYNLGIPSGLFPSGSPPQTLYAPLLSPMRAIFPSHPIRLDLITRTIFGQQYISWSSSLRSFLHSPVTSSLLGSNILLNTLFSNTLGLHYSLNVSDQVSHPYKKQQIYSSVYINLYIFRAQSERQRILHRIIARIPDF